MTFDICIGYYKKYAIYVNGTVSTFIIMEVLSIISPKMRKSRSLILLSKNKYGIIFSSGISISD